MPSDHASWKKRCKEKCRSSERTCDLHVLARTSRRICRVKLKYLFGSVALHALREVASYSIYAVLCITIYSKAFGVLTFDSCCPLGLQVGINISLFATESNPVHLFCNGMCSM